MNTYKNKSLPDHKINSPLDPNKMAFPVEKFETKKVISLYKSLGVDVSNKFKKPVFYLYQCESTGYRFYYPSSLLGDSSFYKELSEKKQNYYSKRWEHKKSLDFIKKEDKVLEIGSGFGSFLELLREEKIEAKGIELNSHAVIHCQEKKLDVEKKLIEELSRGYGEHFDVVCTFQVLEHIYEVHNFIESQLITLKENGRLIIGVPNNNPYLFITDKYHTLNLPPHHAGLWSEKSILSLEKIFNLKLEKLVYEPLNYSYTYFIDFHMNRITNFKIRKIVKDLERISRPVLKKVLCRLIKGRNILVVYKKL